MGSKYVDTPAILQVIGSVYNQPQLLDYSDKYLITDEDFPDVFHKVLFGSIYKIHELGGEKIDLNNILDYLSTRPKSDAIFKKENGEEWLYKASAIADPANFDYYYGRLKKMTLLRAFDKIGVDVSDIYDPDNIIDTKKRESQEEKLDNSSLEQLADIVQNRVEEIKSKYVNGSFGEPSQAAEGIFDLISEFKKHPEVGVPLYGPLINTVTRGARLRKLYLRSAATGVGNFCRF